MLRPCAPSSSSTMASALLQLAALAGVVALLLSNAAEARVLLTLDDFGAVGDGMADDTQALVSAWSAACATNDHTTLHVPAGRSYLISPVTLAGPCMDEIKLFISGSIVAPDGPDDWEQADRTQWLHFSRVQDLSLSGGGTIDGRGEEWWAQACKRKHHHDNDNHCTPQPAPKALHFEDCHGIKVQGITLQNSAQQHLTFTRCSNVRASYLKVNSPEHSPDTNGIHLVDSKNVHIMENLISTGGDCVSMVGNCTDVRLSYISCGPGNGISIGTSSENPAADKVQKIEVENAFLTNTTNGVSIKTWQDGCGFARKVKFQNIVMSNVTNPIVIEQYRSKSSNNPAAQCATPTGNAVAVEKIEYTDITGTSASKRAVTFSCSDAVPCRRIELKNVNLTRVGGHGQPSAYCRRASGKTFGVVVPESCLAVVSLDAIQQVSDGDVEDSDS